MARRQHRIVLTPDAWSFTADDAYAKLRHVYPTPEQDTVREIAY